jgi:hypothetical protein
MASEQLKSMVKEGRYRPDPALVAEAMLSRKSVRDLLTGNEPRAGRSRQTAVGSRRAA